MNVKEIKYFSPDEKIYVPDGPGIHKSGFIRECELNKNKFTASIQRGGVIIFPSGAEIDIAESLHPINNSFKGKYITSNHVFDEKSLTYELTDISSLILFYLAEELAIKFKQEVVLVKDLNVDKFIFG